MAAGVRPVDLVSDAFKRDPLPTWEALREAGPAVRAKLPLVGECWLVPSHAEVSAVLKAPERFVVDARNAGRGRFDALRVPVPRMLRALADNMLGHDDPTHRRLRNLVESAFRRRGVGGLRGDIERSAEALLDDAVARAGRDGVFDLVENFARPLPLAVICELLGLPAEDRPRFTRWARPLAEASAAFDLLRMLPGLWRLTRYLRGEFERCRREGGEGLVAALVEVEDAGDSLSEEELLSMVFLLLIAGHETTAHLISGGVVALLGQPDAAPRFSEDAPGAAVDELLRFVTPVQMTKPRYATADTEIGGTRIARGEMLFPVLAAANFDPEVFDAPERLDLARHPNPHLAFGSGVHSCLGLQLAKAEAEVAFTHLFARMPKLQLAAPMSELRWTRRLGIRALRSLPVVAQ